MKRHGTQHHHFSDYRIRGITPADMELEQQNRITVRDNRIKCNHPACSDLAAGNNGENLKSPHIWGCEDFKIIVTKISI